MIPIFYMDPEASWEEKKRCTGVMTFLRVDKNKEGVQSAVLHARGTVASTLWEEVATSQETHAGHKPNQRSFTFLVEMFESKK